MDRASRVRVSGPLASYAAEFRGQLLGLGYAPASAGAHLGLMAQLSRWLAVEGLSPAGLTPERIEAFLIANRAQGHRFPKSPRGSALLIEFLRAEANVPAASPPVSSGAGVVLDRFRSYLWSERGLTAGTVCNHVHAARLFLESVGAEGFSDLELLSPHHINEFILEQSRRRGVASMKCMVTGLRSLLRFLHVEGVTRTSLAGQCRRCRAGQ